MVPTALVTGGARRIGRALCLGLAEAGFDIVVNHSQSADAAGEVVRQVESLGRRAIAVQADVSESAEVEKLSQAVRGTFGRLDLLVNNASLFQTGRLLEVEEADWDRVMAVNLKAPFLTLKAMADLLESSGGSVLNLVDLSAFEPWVNYPHHAVSKAGLLHLTRVMARAMAPRVRVNAIAPGTVLPSEQDTPEQKEALRARTALGTLGTPDDVVRTALFLHRSPFITGEVVVVDGGRLLSGGR
jgi:pteridine reductase